MDAMVRSVGNKSGSNHRTNTPSGTHMKAAKELRKGGSIRKVDMGYDSNVDASVTRNVISGLNLEIVLGILWQHFIFIRDIPKWKDPHPIWRNVCLVFVYVFL